MGNGAEIDGIERLLAKLTKMIETVQEFRDVSCAVGYTATYALYVHENVAMKWRGLPRSSGFTKEGGIAYVPGKYLSGGTAGFKKHGFYWDPPGRGQAKFLETPLREKRDILAQIIVDVMGKGKTLSQALLAAGLRLQRESQLLVPVDTGNLKASAFTRIENGPDAGATASPD